MEIDGFFGRSEELRRLQAHLDAVVAGQASEDARLDCTLPGADLLADGTFTTWEQALRAVFAFAATCRSWRC